jgi:CBS domain-containing protein
MNHDSFREHTNRASPERETKMRIDQIMNRPVAMCGADDNLHTAARLMWEHDCGALPVTDRQGQLIGVITDRDICMATYSQGKAPQDIAVSSAMAKQAFSCHAADSLESAEKLMSRRQIRRLPVIDGDNRPIGMLSLNDIARHAASSKKNDHEIVQTMAAICEPHGQSLRAAPQVQAVR